MSPNFKNTTLVHLIIFIVLDNAIPITSRFSNFHDTALLDLLPMLDLPTMSVPS